MKRTITIVLTGSDDRESCDYSIVTTPLYPHDDEIPENDPIRSSGVFLVGNILHEAAKRMFNK